MSSKKIHIHEQMFISICFQFRQMRQFVLLPIVNQKAQLISSKNRSFLLISPHSCILIWYFQSNWKRVYSNETLKPYLDVFHLVIFGWEFSQHVVFASLGEEVKLTHKLHELLLFNCIDNFLVAVNGMEAEILPGSVVWCHWHGSLRYPPS